LLDLGALGHHVDQTFFNGSKVGWMTLFSSTITIIKKYAALTKKLLLIGAPVQLIAYD